MFNKPTQITSLFKDYLVQDEIAEFLKRYYTDDESRTKLIRLSSYFLDHFKIFPNYVTLTEKTFMYKNIERKQRAINEKQYIIAHNQQLKDK